MRLGCEAQGEEVGPDGKAVIYEGEYGERSFRQNLSSLQVTDAASFADERAGRARNLKADRSAGVPLSGVRRAVLPVWRTAG